MFPITIKVLWKRCDTTWKRNNNLSLPQNPLRNFFFSFLLFRSDNQSLASEFYVTRSLISFSFLLFILFRQFDMAVCSTINQRKIAIPHQSTLYSQSNNIQTKFNQTWFFHPSITLNEHPNIITYHCDNCGKSKIEYAGKKPFF